MECFLPVTQMLKRNIVARKTLSSAVLGGEGLFNMSLQGVTSAVAFRVMYRKDELIEGIELENDELKSMAI